MKSAHGLFKLALCSLILLGCVSCVSGTDQTSYAATPTIPNFTLAPPTSTADLSIVWSPIPDLNATADYILSALPPPESNSMWTFTPGWLIPPTLTFTPSDTPTPTIIFDTPKPGQEQGIRGRVLRWGGPASDDGLAVTPWPASGVGIIVLDSATKQVIAQTVSGHQGMYEIKLLPGRYDVCAEDMCEHQGIIVTAGSYTTIEIGVLAS